MVLCDIVPVSGEIWCEFSGVNVWIFQIPWVLSVKHARWFKQMKGIVSFDVTTRFNPNQKSIAIYNSHIFNDHNTTIKDQLTHSKYTEVFFYYPCVRQYFYINHMHSKSSHCNISKFSDNLYITLYRKYTRTLSTLLWNLMTGNLTSLRYKSQFPINTQSQNNQVKHHPFLSRPRVPVKVRVIWSWIIFCINRILHLRIFGLLQLQILQIFPQALLSWAEHFFKLFAWHHLPDIQSGRRFFALGVN